jgi:hypothetical protein
MDTTITHGRHPAAGAPDERCWAQEKIGLKCIKIKHASAGCVAVVGSFFAADNLLGAWSKSSKKDFECRFEITYLDDCVIAGAQLIKTARRKPTSSSLTKHVRCAFNGVGEPVVWISRAGGQSASHFLERYDTDDFSFQA